MSHQGVGKGINCWGASYILAKANHRVESRKAFKEIYYYTIEFISETAEDYFQKWFLFSSIVNAASKLTVEKGRVFLLFQPS